MENFVPLGRVGAPFGIYGWNHFLILADDPKAWLQLSTWYLGNEQKGYRPIHHKKINWRGEKCLVQLENNHNREKAFEFEGLFLGAPLADLPALPKDEFYWAELKNMRLVLPDGSLWANVIEVMESPAHAILVAQDDQQKTHLLPFVPSVIVKVDKHARQIWVDWEKDW